MGIHTGESIVVAPSQTLTNDEYHRLREIAIRVVRHLGIVGECNIQYALDPPTATTASSRSTPGCRAARPWPPRRRAIPSPSSRPSSPSATACRTSGTRSPGPRRPASSRPSTTSWSRSRAGTSRSSAASRKKIGSEMKSVGEVMAIGRTFEEALQKAARMLEIGVYGLVGQRQLLVRRPREGARATRPTSGSSASPRPSRRAASVDRIHELTRIDRWFLHKIKSVVDCRGAAQAARGRRPSRAELLREAKRKGFSDKQIAAAAPARRGGASARARKRYGIVPSSSRSTPWPPSTRPRPTTST